MPRVKLTKREVERLRPAINGDLVVWDADLLGFGVRVKPSGRRSYMVQYRNAHGRSRRVTLGRHGVLTLDQARRAARKLLGEVAANEDPAGERRKVRGEPTMADLAEFKNSDHRPSSPHPSSRSALSLPAGRGPRIFDHRSSWESAVR